MLRATTNSDLWFTLLQLASSTGYHQTIQRGSFEGETYRLQIPFVAAEVLYPLVDMVPAVPVGIPCPTTLDTIEAYYRDYLLGRDPAANEAYTYGSRIGDQLECVMEMLRVSPGTNQAVIEIGRPEDVTLSDPACLRLLDFKVEAGALNMMCVWRSNDLWAGFPTNMGGLALLLKDVAEYAGLETGCIRYVSHGTHLYGYQLELARTKLGVYEFTSHGLGLP